MTLQHHQASPPHYRNTPPRATATQAAPAGDLREALTLLGLITDGQQGWLEISVIMGDPSDRRTPDTKARRRSFTPDQLDRMSSASRQSLLMRWGYIFGREWMHISSEQDTAAAARRCLALGKTYGDVYVSSGLYTEPDRFAPMLPSRLIFLDDAPANPPKPYRLATQTSTGSRHGYYQTTERVETAERVERSRRMAAALGADPSGADAKQIVRVPGTFNTKGGGRYHVHITHEGGPIYTADELLADCPSLPILAAADTVINDQAVAFWLGNIEQLVDSRGVPYGVTSEAARALWLRSWHDTSARRYTLAISLIVKHHYPDDQAAAILYHVAGDCGRKGDSWLAADIARCIDKARQECPAGHEIRPRRMGANHQPKLPAALPSQPPRRKGRPAQLTAATYLAWLELQSDGWPVVFITRREAAAQLGVSMQIIGRLERKLAEAGHCYRDTDHHDSWVAFGPKADDRGVIKNAPTGPDPAAPMIEVLSEVTEQPNTETALERENSNDVYGIKEHTAPIVPARPAPALASASPAPPVVMSPASSAAAVAAGACVPLPSEQDGLPVGDHGSADDWAALLSSEPPTSGDYAPPPANATEQLNALERGTTPPRRLAASKFILPRDAEARARRMHRQADADLGRPNRVQPTAVSLHNQSEAPPPPAAPAALPPLLPVQPAQDDPRLAGIDWQAAARAWDRGRIEKFCEVHRLDREAMISHFIQAARAA